MQRTRRKRGPMSELENRTALSLKMANASLTASAIAKALRKRKHTVACFLHEAREKLQAAAPMAAEHAIKASAIAAMRGDAGPAQWILEHVSEGEVRVVDPPRQVQASQGVTVNIGLGLGLVPSSIDVRTLPASVPMEAERMQLNHSNDET